MNPSYKGFRKGDQVRHFKHPECLGVVVGFTAGQVDVHWDYWSDMTNSHYSGVVPYTPDCLLHGWEVYPDDIPDYYSVITGDLNADPVQSET